MTTGVIADLSDQLGAPSGVLPEFARAVGTHLAAKRAFEVDAVPVRRLKGILRRSEARAAAQACGLKSEGVRFLDLRFYENGRYRQFSPGEDDVAAVAGVLRELAPHQVFAAGHRDDPSSVAAVCFKVVRAALTQVQPEPWFQHCRVWLYRGIEAPWNAAEVDMAVPISPRELVEKIQAIRQHKTQRGQNLSEPGVHEPWQQAERNNRLLAGIYDALGLANYEAIEAFERFNF